ncbi:hypothetical protein CcrColossus_gp408 [Caulobacter phage CcrColossus]|uniref:Uncharacterized protein n=1 Tax=Caulobacter phage CcrColossus TaxID=1211640 RepID=K4JWJ1_9CAUD|nr:hypothetical protein CcrColossus_gp408 [Caulobacter phage CcrColossus]AFU88278.1 hypothetical protein CcrColossus_gp408 [Caulobacter phage CcrColossus]
MKMPDFRDDGPDPKGAYVCWVLHKLHNGGWWDQPERWAVTYMISETEKTWMRPYSSGVGQQRGLKDLIKGRFTTRQEAEAARLAAIEVFQDIAAREAEVERLMVEAMRPFKDRLKQLAAEQEDRLSEITK